MTRSRHRRLRGWPTSPIKFREAGRTDTIFADAAVEVVHQVSRGLPRAVNNLATQALVAAYAEKKSVVDEASARMAAAEVDAE